jgi:hypothetical protein
MSIQEDALRLLTLDRRLIRAVVEWNPDELSTAVVEYQSLRKSLKVRLLDEPVSLVENAEAAEVIKKILGGCGLPSDKVIEQLSSHLSADGMLTEFDDEEITQLGADLFYNWFSHHEYITGLAELRPLLVRAKVADSVSRLVRQAKDCYAFQQYDAAYSLCRTIIEASVRDICVRCQLFPNLGENVVLFEKHRWCDLRDKVSSGSLRDSLKMLYADLSTVLHGRKSVSRVDAHRAFKNTLQMVEQLYSANNL